jgi:hypothetical protein
MPVQHDIVPAALDAVRDPAPDLRPAPLVLSLDALWEALQAQPEHHAAHLGDALVKAGLVSPGLLAQMLARQAAAGAHVPLGELLVQQGLISAAQLRQTLASWLGVPTVDLHQARPELTALDRLPRALAQRESVLPLMLRDDMLVVALQDPWDHRLLDMLRFVTELKVRPVLAAPGSLLPAIAQAYRLASAPSAADAGKRTAESASPAGAAATLSTRELVQELNAGEPASGPDADGGVISESDNVLVRLVNRIIADAVELRASGHPHRDLRRARPVRVRLRVDGDLLPYLELPARCASPWWRASRSWPTWTSPSTASRRTARSTSRASAACRSSCAWSPCRPARGLEDVVLRLLGGMKPLPLDGIGLSEDNLAGAAR